MAVKLCQYRTYLYLSLTWRRIEDTGQPALLL
jgi:hypothetical protein